MRARACAAILVAFAMHSGDGGSRQTGGGDVIDAGVLAGVHFDPRADRELVAHRPVHHAVWVDDASHFAEGHSGICIEIVEACADCARSVAEIDGSDPCTRASHLIAF